MQELEKSKVDTQMWLSLSILKKLKHMFGGRIGRADFYISLMLNAVVIVGLGWITVEGYMKIYQNIPGGNVIMLIFSPLMFVLGILSLVFLLSVIIRRLHDMNMDGWLFFLIFIPIVDLFFLLVPGTKGKNKYGIDRSDDPFVDMFLNRPSETSQDLSNALLNFGKFCTLIAHSYT